MAKVSNPKRFSDVFAIDPKRLRKRGAFDPILNADTPLFIDLLLLEQSKHTEMPEAHRRWMKHFEDVIVLLSNSTGRGDLAWRQADRLLQFPEFKGTCLGYGTGIAGSGIGDGLRSRIIQTAYEIIQLGIRDPRLFAMLPLLEKDFGPDRISDLTTRIIATQLANFTVRVLDGFNIPTYKFRLGGQAFGLPVNPFEKDRRGILPVVLVPLDVLRNLPIACDWNGVQDSSDHNAAFRQRINERFGMIMTAHAKISKNDRRVVALSSKRAFESLLEGAKQVAKESYDFENDPTGVVHWLEEGHRIAAQFPVTLALPEKSLAAVVTVVETIISHFKHLVEKNGIWKSFYDPTGKLMNESYAQQVFFVAAESYCRANNVDLSPETNQGGGPVDFKLSGGFHARVLVELKWSSSSRLEHGYRKQLEVYKAGESTETAYFVVLEV